LHSVNYLHFGAPKSWYVAAPSVFFASNRRHLACWCLLAACLGQGFRGEVFEAAIAMHALLVAYLHWSCPLPLQAQGS
jgi:hypothetical protein